MRWNAIDWVAWAFIIVGALNWGFIGFFNVDVIDSMFSTSTGMTRLIYGVVGLAGVWQLVAVLVRSGSRHH